MTTSPPPSPPLPQTKTWQEIVADKRTRQALSIPKEWILPIDRFPGPSVQEVIDFPESVKCGLLTTGDIEVTGANFDALLMNLTSGDWTAVGVLKAFAKRAVIAHQLTNCLTEIFIDKALKRAAELDAHYERTGKPIGPLHGLPISLKDQICIEGLETSMGYVSWLGEYATENAVLVDLLIKAGAVPYVRTNVPQTLMWPEAFNNVFGRTTNPYNRLLTPGGSSGGEGALIALRGSPLGVGSDIGGSVRIPANFCGLYALRPSAHRVPYAKCRNSLEGQDSVPSVLGPMSNSISGCKTFLKVIADSKPWLRDAMAIRKPWNESEYNLCDHNKGRMLCFGIIWDDEVTRPHPPIIRALEKVKAALGKARHKVVDWHPYKHAEIYSTLSQIWDTGAFEDYSTTIAATSEPLIETMGVGEDRPETNFRPTKHETPITAFQSWQLNRKKRDLRQEYLEAWEATAATTGTGRPLDGIISPLAPWPAPPHGHNNSASYTMVFNFLDYPAMAIPVTRVDPKLDQQRPRKTFYNDADKAHYEGYNPDTYKNSPVGIQIVGRTLEDEAVLGMAEIIDKALRAHG